MSLFTHFHVYLQYVHSTKVDLLRVQQLVTGAVTLKYLVPYLSLKGAY